MRDRKDIAKPQKSAQTGWCWSISIKFLTTPAAPGPARPPIFQEGTLLFSFCNAFRPSDRASIKREYAITFRSHLGSFGKSEVPPPLAKWRDRADTNLEAEAKFRLKRSASRLGCDLAEVVVEAASGVGQTNWICRSRMVEDVQSVHPKLQRL